MGSPAYQIIVTYKIYSLWRVGWCLNSILVFRFGSRPKKIIFSWKEHKFTSWYSYPLQGWVLYYDNLQTYLLNICRLCSLSCREYPTLYCTVATLVLGSNNKTLTPRILDIRTFLFTRKFWIPYKIGLIPGMRFFTLQANEIKINWKANWLKIENSTNPNTNHFFCTCQLTLALPQD